jgi:hypothetical protein
MRREGAKSAKEEAKKNQIKHGLFIRLKARTDYPA